LWKEVEGKEKKLISVFSFLYVFVILVEERMEGAKRAKKHVHIKLCTVKKEGLGETTFFVLLYSALL